MTYIFIAAIAIVFVAKLVEHRLPGSAYRAVVLAGVIIPLAGVAYAISVLWTRSVGWTELALLVGLLIATGLGTTLGYHRLVAHHSFEARMPVRALFLVLGSAALQGNVLNWAAWHRKHHALSDQPGDPHSPLDGFFHAHVGWILRATPAERDRWCRDLMRDRLVVFVDRTTFVWVGLGLAIPYAIAGWPGLLWGGLVRIALGNHLTFAVNSVCHTFGRQPFETRDASRNNWVFGLFSLGEGWHNNHHAFPSMACHGMGWRQPDVTGLVIRLLERLRLAWAVKRPDARAVERRLKRPTPVLGAEDSEKLRAA